MWLKIINLQSCLRQKTFKKSFIKNGLRHNLLKNPSKIIDFAGHVNPFQQKVCEKCLQYI